MAQQEFLKKDTFGEIRLICRPDGDFIVRDTATARYWCRWLARYLLRRETRCLALLQGLHGVPQLHEVSATRLSRGYIPGAPMQIAKPTDPLFFRQAAALLRQLHRHGVAHNDLAKEPNIIVQDNGQPAFIDFQLATLSKRRGRLFRMLAYDDLRHLLKHKRTYCPEILTAREQRILARPSLPSRVWMASGKPVYLFITRRLLGWADREGAGDRGEIR